VKLTRLNPGETMAQRRAKDLLLADCDEVARAIWANPGLPSKYAVADETGLSVERVHECLRAINANQTPELRVEYGVSTAKRGCYAGQKVRGWWPMSDFRHQQVMEQADDHRAACERGIRIGRICTLAAAAGFTTQAAKAVVVKIEAELGIRVDQVPTAEDFDAVTELALETLARNGATA